LLSEAEAELAKAEMLESRDVKARETDVSRTGAALA
jgi:hypothetical protein